jgi:hypothetical protein
VAESRRESARPQREAETAAGRGVEEAQKTTEHGAKEAETTTEHGAKEAETTTQHGAKEAETTTEQGIKETERVVERGVEALRWQTERVEEGARQASKTSAAAVRGVARTGLALADATEEIVEVWTHYAEDVMRNTSQASQALLRSRSIPEVVQAQAAFVCDNLQSFLDHSAKIADTAGRIATRPLEVLREVSAEQAQR